MAIIARCRMPPENDADSIGAHVGARVPTDSATRAPLCGLGLDMRSAPAPARRLPTQPVRRIQRINRAWKIIAISSRGRPAICSAGSFRSRGL